MINSAKIDGHNNIVIQGSDNTEITVNLDNPEEVRKFFIDFQNKLEELPKKILDIMESMNPNEVEIKTGANIYLGLNLLISDMGVYGLTFGVSITNLTKENRFFNQPFFKLSVPFDKGVDSFAMTSKVNNVQFPKKLEYGEVVTEDYNISPSSVEIYRNVIQKDPNATIQVISSTTIGEIYKSNEYSVSKLLENFRYILR